MNKAIASREAATKLASRGPGLIGHDLTPRKGYVRRMAPLCEPFGGECLGASVASWDVLEGTWQPGLVVGQRWPSTAPCHGSAASEISQPLQTLRHQTVTAALVLWEGLR
jgi:hypothetical protein